MGSMHYVVCASRAYAEANGMPADLDALRTAPLIASAVVSRQLRVTAYLGNRRHEVLGAHADLRELPVPAPGRAGWAGHRDAA